jgi:biopolymer transport protein ExbD
MFGRKKRKAEKPLETDINRVVTPMLDMTFQLLFYFVINFKPPIAEGQIDLSLPKEEEGKPLQAPEDKLDQDKADEYRITAHAIPGAKSGEIDYIEFKVKDLKPDTFSGARMYDDLKKAIQAIPKPAEGSKAKPPVLKIESDNRLKYSELLRLMNLCRENGFKEVGVLPIPKKANVVPKADMGM